MNELENHADNWYLKTPDGERFGPVTLATLQRWAGQGRIMPGTLISIDEQKWKPAHMLDALAMDCVVRTGPNSFYGPIHAAAVDVYIRDGIIPANSAVYATRPNESARLVEKLETQFKDDHTARQQDALHESEKQIAAALAERDAARQSAAELEAGLHAASAEIQRLAAALADAQTLHADAEARFQETLRNLETARREKDALNQELELLRDKQAATSQALAENKAVLGQFHTMVQNFNEKLHHLSGECARLQPPETANEPPQPPPSGEKSLAQISTATFDPTTPEGDSPLARLENQVRAELASLKNTPDYKSTGGFSLASLFKKSALK